jgi:hypothetical protein
MKPAAGPQVVSWTGVDDNGRAVSPGVFFLRIRAEIVHLRKR